MTSIHNRLTTLRRDQRGISNMLVGFAFVGFMAATTLALDVGWFVVARSQAQNSADAGALAGAVALVFNDFNNRSASGPAVTSAISAAKENDVAYGDVEVGPEDVTFPTGPTGLNNRVGVRVDREIPTILGSFFGAMTMDSKAYAEAEASPANAARCLLPFMIPDKWREVTAPPWDQDSMFEMYNKKGQLLNPRDIYVGGSGPEATGYKPALDKGTLITLKTENTSKVSPGIYNPWAIPGSNGAEDYRDAIANCRTGTMRTDQVLVPEPGNMVGPTIQGIEDLVAKDQSAHWDFGCNCVKGSRFGLSPRIRPIPLYDPVYYENGKQTGRVADFKMVSFLGVFVVGMNGSEIQARIHPISAEAMNDPSLTTSSFAQAIRLVK